MSKNTEYEVIVGNIGTVYCGNEMMLALRAYSAYKEQSKSNYGRASNEFVFMMKDGDILYEYCPQSEVV